MYQLSCSLLLLPLLALSRHALAQVNDTFTVNCAILSQQRSDPLVNPGAPSSHVHVIVGGNAFGRDMTPADAVAATGTTCDKNIDRSNYWIPQLYHIRSDGMYELVPITGSSTYYQNRACDYNPKSKSCDKSKVAKAFPHGFSMIAGDTNRRTYDPNDFSQKAVSYMCDAKGETRGFPTQHCDMIRSQIYFPSCWTGGDVAPAGFKSHVAYPMDGFDGGMCPPSHPISIMSIFYEFGFDTKAYTDFDKFVWSNGDTTGYGLHGDFINGWQDLNALQDAFHTCSGQFSVDSPGCSITHGDRKKNSASQQKLMKATVFEEDIGLTKPLKKLPGPGSSPAPPSSPGTGSTTSSTSPTTTANTGSSTPTSKSSPGTSAPQPSVSAQSNPGHPHTKPVPPPSPSTTSTTSPAPSSGSAPGSSTPTGDLSDEFESVITGCQAILNKQSPKVRRHQHRRHLAARTPAGDNEIIYLHGSKWMKIEE